MAEEIMEPAPRTSRLSKSIDEVTRYMDKQGVDSVLVTNPDGKLLGLLVRDEIEQAGRSWKRSAPAGSKGAKRYKLST